MDKRLHRTFCFATCCIVTVFLTCALSAAFAATEKQGSKVLFSGEKSTTPSTAMAASEAPNPATSEESQKFQERMAVLSEGKTPETLPGSSLKSEEPKAAEEKKPEAEEPKLQAKQATGTVTGVSRQGIAIQYGVDAKNGSMEVWLNYGKNVKLSGYKDLSEIQIGDRAVAVYDEYPDLRKSVREIEMLKRKPKDDAEPMR